MRRTRYYAATLALLMAGVAQATTWNFSYQGFYDDGPATWVPDYTIFGNFTGNDADSNGIISLGELAQFSVDGYELLADPECPNPGVGLLCSLDSFSFHLTGALHFDGTASYHDEVFGSFRRWIAGDRFDYSHYDPTGSTYRTLYWTEDTVFSIAPPPIPEPSITVMASAGALLIGIRLRQRRRPQD